MNDSEVMPGLDTPSDSNDSDDSLYEAWINNLYRTAIIVFCSFAFFFYYMLSKVDKFHCGIDGMQPTAPLSTPPPSQPPYVTSQNPSSRLVLYTPLHLIRY
jgi:hypothetical protein